jgi:hypothetical protein
MRSRLLRLALAALLLTAAAAPSAAVLARRSFDAFKRALAERDGEAAVALLSTPSLAEWERERHVALHGSPDEVHALAPGPRLAVLALRHAQPVFLLRDGTPPELAAAAVRSGLADREALELIEISDIAARGDQASGQLTASGLPSGVRAGFVRERGAWKLDLPASLDAAGRMVAQTARATGSSEDAVIVNLIGAASGERVGDEIWQPLLRDRGAAHR